MKSLAVLAKTCDSFSVSDRAGASIASELLREYLDEVLLFLLLVDVKFLKICLQIFIFLTLKMSFVYGSVTFLSN